ncbi:hypothetical protein [Dethiosulfatarculus sandiegensis]|uniref:Uncharacterized protein n=1 Tax=Dethiosulfatarculus sandiegensis TaxID=1429043 RepID=A0A0D2JUQ8_9BACT|nr:hypothetical protein [Dethiosulfatarculus sandiegensis]KIX13270.1 hypothetical protein X474_14865 [Dethiosulfatarculus sandiegensis]
MFARFFSADPLKVMNTELAKQTPDSNFWKHLSKYLVQGVRPKDDKAEAVIKTYLDLRDSLGVRAVFRHNAVLSHEALAEPCRSFFCKYSGHDCMESSQLMFWARFCLAADHLLAVAYEARLETGEARKRRMDALMQFFAKVQTDYLNPLQREGQRPRDLAGDNSREFEGSEPAGFESAQAA